MEYFILIIYIFFLSYIFCYSLVQAHLVWIYLSKRKKTKAITNQGEGIASSPRFVSIQLPIYNELYVIERVIDACVKLNYPKDFFEIQILDDSTDETSEIIANKVAIYKNQGFQIHHIQRKDRQGFKAGALIEGLKIAKGEFIAVFDADFVPHPDFLLKTLPLFENPKIGLVQTPWLHLNEDYSFLTKMQAFGLDAHFVVEQTGRNRGGYFMNFNGTAGIWRKTCIEDAGGWHTDTLTEDLDLSYRAQLKDWQFIFTQEIGSPAELPMMMNAIKTQQFRWTKGAAECARKNLFSVLKSKNITLLTKIHAFFHLSNSFIFVSVIMSALFSIPVLWIKNNMPQFNQLFDFVTLLLLGFVVLITFYWIPQRKKSKNFLSALLQFIQTFPLFLAMSMGLSLHNAIAVLEGYFGKKSSFVRTPKFNIQKKNESWQANKYIQAKIHWLNVVEGLLAIYFAFGIYMAFQFRDFGLLPFHLLLTLGFASISYYSFLHNWMINDYKS